MFSIKLEVREKLTENIQKETCQASIVKLVWLEFYTVDFFVAKT